MCMCARTPFTDVCVSAHAYECAYSFLCVRVHARDDDALLQHLPGRVGFSTSRVSTDVMPPIAPT
jgi:hypothetical protein